MRISRRAAGVGVLGLAVAGLTTLALVHPVAAQTTATNPVRIVSGYANGPKAMPDALTKIRALPLPSGKWAISAKLFVYGGTYAHCTLSAGADSDWAKAGIDGSGGTITATLSMNVVHPLSASGRAVVRCTDQGSGMTWTWLKITATSGGSIKNTLLTS